MKAELRNQFVKELEGFKDARYQGKHEECFRYLSRAHILSQKSVRLHLRVHWIMFLYALSRDDAKEVRGQALRLLVTIPGHLFGRVPLGNIGWSTVKLTQTMPIPEDLKDIYNS